MDFDTVMATLRAQGKPSAAKTYARHGVTEPSFGISYADLGKLIKTIKTDHALALKLWATGNHDARVLATKVADPGRLSQGELEGWLGEARNYIITDAVATLASRRDDALKLGLRWIDRDDEWGTAAGWSVLGQTAMRGGLPAKDAERLLTRIRKEIHGAKNRTRYSMNNALIAIGGTDEALRPLALEAARAIGKVEVDHGETGCKTPDAVEYIAKMVAHKERGGGAKAATKAAAKTTAKKAAAKKPLAGKRA